MTNAATTGATTQSTSGADPAAGAREPGHRYQPHPTFVRRLLVGVITGYQRLISPWLGPRCRFTPSCSEYAQEAILLRGPVLGVGLAVFRLLRCQPLCAGGYDPVPLPRAVRGPAARSVRDSLKDSDPTDASDASAEGASAC